MLVSLRSFLQQCSTKSRFSLQAVVLSKKENIPFETSSRAQWKRQAEMSLWHKKELCENRQLAYLKVKVAPTENLLWILQSRAWCRRDIYTHYVCVPRCEKIQPPSTAQAGWNPLKFSINRNLHKSQSTLSYQCPIGRPEWSHWEKRDIYI